MPPAAVELKPYLAIDLPWPPSANRIWRSRRNKKSGKLSVYRSPNYTRWQKQAGLEWMVQKPKGFQILGGKFRAWIVLCPPPNLWGRKWDKDNRVKALFDILQSLSIIQDDSLCHQHEVRLGEPAEAPMGARIILRPLPNRS